MLRLTSEDISYLHEFLQDLINARFKYGLTIDADLFDANGEIGRIEWSEGLGEYIYIPGN